MTFYGFRTDPEFSAHLNFFETKPAGFHSGNVTGNVFFDSPENSTHFRLSFSFYFC